MAIAIGGGSLVGFASLYFGWFVPEEPVVSNSPPQTTPVSNADPYPKCVSRNLNDVIEEASNLEIVKAFDERFPNSKAVAEEQYSSGQLGEFDTCYAIAYHFSYQADQSSLEELRTLRISVGPSFNVIRASLACGSTMTTSVFMESNSIDSVEQVKTICPLSYEEFATR